MEEDESCENIYVAPLTIEQLLIAIGEHEAGAPMNLIFSHELAVDIALRLIRLEDRVGINEASDE